MEFAFRFPDVAEGIIEGKLIDWKVNEGQTVEADHPLCEMETDKSVLEMPSPKKGLVKRLHFKAGDIVKVGEVLVTLDVDAEAGAADADAAAPAEQAPQQIPQKTPTAAAPSGASAARARGAVTTAGISILPKDRRLADKLHVDITALTGTGQGGRITEDDIKGAAGMPAASQPAQEPAQEPAGIRAWPGEQPGAQPGARPEAQQDAQREAFAHRSSVDAAGRIRASPSVRKLARELGVDIETVVSSSPDGTIGADDVQRAAHGEEIKAAPKRAVAPHTIETAEQASRARKTVQPLQEHEGDVREKIEGVRAIIKRRMEEANRYIPHAAVAVEVDIGNLIQEREHDKELLKEKGITLTYLAFIIKVTAAALEKFPRLNASIDDATQEFVLKKHINIGFATDTEHGLVVPNIKDCNHKSISEIAAAVQDLAERARNKRIKPDEVTGGTFSITNVGSFGAVGGLCIINYPEVAILMVSHIQERLELVDGKPVVRKILPLTLTFDHRIIDGADAGRFLNYMAEHLSNPSYMLLDVI